MKTTRERVQVRTDAHQTRQSRFRGRSSSMSPPQSSANPRIVTTLCSEQINACSVNHAINSEDLCRLSKLWQLPPDRGRQAHRALVVSVFHVRCGERATTSRSMVKMENHVRNPCGKTYKLVSRHVTKTCSTPSWVEFISD